MTPLICLPGLLCDERLWREPVAALADIAQAQLADLTQDENVAAMAARTLSAAPPRFALAALSMGGYVAFEMLRQAPERVTRLALFDTSARLDDPRRLKQRRLGLAAVSRGRFMGVTPRLLPQLVHASHLHDAVGEEVMAMAQRVGREAFLRQQRAIVDRPDSLPGLAQIKVPTLIAVGDSDRMTPPEHAHELHARIAGSRLHVFRDCGHLPPLEQPRETAAVLREWLLA